MGLHKAVLSLPLKVPVTKKQDFYVNLNQYRNAHFHILNKAKVTFKEMIQDQLVQLPEYDWVRLRYYLYPSTKRDMDTNNICSIADKFFSDALVEAGKLEDDNYHFVRHSTFQPANIDKQNPRVDVHIYGKVKETAMKFQVNLDNDDFNTALLEYVERRLPDMKGREATFDITAGRGDKGYSAVVTFGDQIPVDNAATLVLKRTIQEEGNVMNRLSEDAIPKEPTKRAMKAKVEPEVQTAQETEVQVRDETPFVLEETKSSSNPFADMNQTNQTTSLFETKAEAAEATEIKETAKPLFDFSGGN